MKHPPRHILEYAFLRSTAALLNALPYRCALALAAGIGWLVYRCMRGRAAEARRRIRFVFGDRYSDREVRRIAWRSWRNFVFSLVEIVRIPRLTRRWIERRMAFDSLLAAAEPYLAENRGVVITLPHMGSWEMAGLMGHFKGLPLFTIAAVQKNRLADAYLNRLRTWHGTTVVPRGAGTMHQVVKRLRRGEMVAILPDVRHRQPGVAVPFLGGTANLSTGAGLFARLGRAVIIPTIVTREGWTRHHVQACEAIETDPEADRDADLERILRAVMAICEKAIRQRPEQWFWFNKRWILDPLT